jgi:hypothetical protein
MGILDQILAQVDNAKRVAARNVKDLVQNPSDTLSMITGRVAEQNKKLASGDSALLEEIVGNAIPGGGAVSTPNILKQLLEKGSQ